MNIQQFLNTSYTAYHTTENVCKILLSQGFEQLEVGKNWDLQQGKGYFVTRNGSSVIAFKVGTNRIFNIVESHTDSPCFKIKGDKLLATEGAKKLNTEKYGGSLMYTFLDRPLKIAGRLLVNNDGVVSSLLVDSSYNVVIPSVAVHQNPSANDGLSLNPQVDMLPLLGQCDDLYATLCDQKVVDADLFVVPADQSFVAGVNGEDLCSARLDNLTSVYTSVTAIANASPSNIAVVACLDNEETGSGTRQGAPSYIEQVLQNIAASLSMDQLGLLYAKENGMVLSVDNGHAVHPNHPEKSDVAMRTYMNKGIIIKHHTNYSTDGLSSAVLKAILTDNNIAFQDLYNKSDMRCGSTLGLVTSRQLGMKTVDIGLPQLAMHSACETCGLSDVDSMQQCITAFLQAPICGNEGGIATK